MGEEEAGGEGRLAAYGDIDEGALGKLHRVGGGQHQGGAVLLEDDQTDAVAALVGVREQREDGALGGVHALGDGHGPGGVHQEEHKVGDALDADLALEVALLDGEGQALALLGAAFLEGGGGAEGGVEGDVVVAVARRARLDIAAVLALGVGERTAPGVLAGQFIERGVELAGQEGLAGLDLLPAFPPVGVGVREDILLLRGGLALLGAFLGFILEL